MTPRRLHIGPKLALPALESQTQTIVVYGGKGMGKTNFGSVFVEELDATGLRFSWIDPVGVAWGLKHSADGKGTGIKVLILGGRHGDLPIEPTTGAVVADLVVDEEISVLIDISRKASGEMWTQGEKIRFVRDYCIRLFQRQGERRRPLMQVIDEAGRFVPQQIPRGAVDIAECTGAIEQLVELGRNVGVGVLLITQRSARMNKSVSELAEMMIAFRTVGPRSIDAIVDWFAEHKRVVQAELEGQLRQLERGSALVVSPGWLRIEGEYAMRARQTFDSSDTPVSGRERRPRGRGAVIDRDMYLSRMAETVDKAKAEDPRELRRQIAELERALKKRPTETERVEVPVEVPIEVPVLSQDQMSELRELVAPVVNGLGSNLERIADRLEGLMSVAATRGGVDVALGGREAAKRVPEKGTAVAESEQLAGQPRTRSGPSAPRPHPRSEPSRPPSAEGISTSQQRILDALASLELIGAAPADRTQLALFAQASPKSSGYTNNLGALRTAGLIDYPVKGTVALTPAGRELADHAGAPSTAEELQDYVRELVGGSRARLIDVLIDVYPGTISKQDLAERADVSANSSGYTNNLGSLRSLRLIDYPRPGYVAALPVLFLEG